MEINDWNGYLVSFDQEKAFDRVEHNYTIQVLKRMNFPPGIIRWIEIIYKDIKSKIQVNGHLTKEIKIERSIRQRCSLSITIYALIIEPLASSIRNSKDIKGINLPNRKDNCALFQHADDCSTITTEISDYDHLVKEFKYLARYREEENKEIEFTNIWKTIVNIKNDIQREFIYKIIHRAVLTGEKQLERGLKNMEPKCKYCNKQIETFEHLFIECKELKLFRQYVTENGQTKDPNFKINKKLLLLYIVDIKKELLPLIYGYTHTEWTCRHYEDELVLYKLQMKYHKDKEIYEKYN
ncbi:unnamed protein product [Mytilus coruscus]|uniref:Reverse transcriptase domain-containing protein n=1 Tax=Mytilus coruscus TaxID=42192 RepID=A0A6J7ZVW2_MYTCO|nr:unnamed protein product [Mytilus coruscus]